MKKFGKYEIRPAGVSEEKPQVKGVLLQTYFTSLVSLVLCVTMFFGTTYAWFTSEVGNVGNEIYIGTLDVELKKAQKDGSWASLSELENDANKTKLFDNTRVWEPGYTALETVKVINEGDLAFKYVLSFRDGTAKDAAGVDVQPAEITKYFDVWVYNYADHENTPPTLTTYNAITQENSGWVYSGSLDQLLAGKVVLEGTVAAPEKTQTVAATEATAATQPAVEAANTHMIALHMKEDADQGIMSHRISLNVKLVAYQKSSESDDLGNQDYDQLVATEADLREAFQKGGNVTLVENVVLTQGVSVPADKTVVLNLNGKTISQEMECTGNYAMISNKGNLTITGEGKISFKDTSAGDPSFGWGSYTIRNEGKLTVENGTIEHLGQQNTKTEVKHMYCALYQYSGSTTINGGKISTPTYRSVRLWKGDMTINGGEFEGQVWVQAVDNSAALTINGGKFAPRGADGSSVFVSNSQYSVALKITGGEFETKVGVSNPGVLAGVITGGVFTENAKTSTNSALFASTFVG